VRQPDLGLVSLDVAAHARQGSWISIESLGISWRDRSNFTHGRRAPVPAARARARSQCELVPLAASLEHATYRSRANER
jgi:hypothetical protein